MTALECVGKGDVPKKPVSSCTITSLIPSKDTDAVAKKKKKQKKKQKKSCVLFDFERSLSKGSIVNPLFWGSD